MLKLKKIRNLVRGRGLGRLSSRDASVDSSSRAQKTSTSSYETRPPQLETRQRLVDDYGLQILYSPSDVKLDIVFVHGLTGQQLSTWSYQDQEPWPKTLLPGDIPDARISAFGYDANVYKCFGEVGQNTIRKHAENLLHEIADMSSEHGGGDTPVIFVAHSLGGLVCKRALLIANTGDEEYAHVLERTRAIAFFGTPHRGSDLANYGLIFANMLSLVSSVNAKIVEVLKRDSETLESITQDFHQMIRVRGEKGFPKLFITCFTEELAVSKAGKSFMVVPSFSATLDSYPSRTIHADHRNMTKFKEGDSGYKTVVSELKRWRRNIVPEHMVTAGMKRNKNTTRPQRFCVGKAESMKALAPSERKLIQALCAVEPTTLLPRSPVEGTLTWVQKERKFLDWFTAGRTTVMCLTGDVGSGKTTIASHLVRLLEENQDPSTLSCWFFFSSRSNKEQMLSCMLCTLLHQLIQRRRPMLDMVKKKSYLRPALFERYDILWELFVQIIKSELDLGFNIVIDAIDECDASSQKQFAENLIRFAATHPSARVKFIITAQPQSRIVNLLENSKVARIRFDLKEAQDLVRSDVRAVIDHYINLFVQKKSCTPQLAGELKHLLWQKAEDSFLWVSLVLHTLDERRLLLKGDLEGVKSLPQRLDDLYRGFLENIPVEDRPLAAMILKMMAVCTRPLTTTETSIHFTGIPEAVDSGVASQFSDESLASLMSPLIKIQDGQLRLVHHSVKEYLTKPADACRGDMELSFNVDYEEESFRLARSCLRYLTCDAFAEDMLATASDDEPSVSTPDIPSPTDGSLDLGSLRWHLGDALFLKDKSEIESAQWPEICVLHPFFDYAATSWAFHLSFCSLDHVRALWDHILSLCDANTSYLHNWTSYVRSMDSRFQGLPSALDLAVIAGYFGHSIVLQELLDQDYQNLQYGQALYHAAKMGKQQCVQLLVKALVDGRRFVIDSCYVNGQSPLSAAAENGHLDAVLQFLKHDLFDMNKPDHEGLTAVSLSVRENQVTVAKALVRGQHGFTDVADKRGLTALHWAARMGCTAGIELLLAHQSVDPNRLDRTNRSALSWAASEGHLAAAERLINDTRVDANMSDVKGLTPFLHAVRSGNLDVVRLMVGKKKIDKVARDGTGRNCISWAASQRSDNGAMLRCLLKHVPTAADQPDHEGWTPLAWAMDPPGYTENVALLVRSGHIDVNRQDLGGRTPLSFAVSYGHLEISRILLEDGRIDADGPDGHGRSPLSYAAAAGRNMEIVRLLAQRADVDVHKPDSSGVTPAAYARRNGHQEVVELLEGGQTSTR